MFRSKGPPRSLGCGQGGIRSARDALEFLIAGATTVGLGTSLFYDPMAAKSINAGIEDYLARHGIASVADLVGSLDVAGRKDRQLSG